VFVVDPGRLGTGSVVAALRSLPGVVVPPGPSDLFDAGLNPVIGNYLTAVHVGGGVSGLATERPFLLALRGLADAVYGAVLERAGADVVVDASPSSARAPQVLPALYPEALVVLVEADGPEPSTPLLPGPRTCRLRPADLAEEPAVLAARLAAAIAETSTSVPPPSDPPSTPTGAQVSPLQDRAIFVVGCPRSGTTWIENLLRAHPSVGGPSGETALFESLGALWDNAARPPGEGLAGWIDRDGLIAAVRRCCDALFGACLAAQETHEATWLLEKTPGHGWHLDLIAAVYPDAWVVSIHRDGRDVARSLVEVTFGSDDLASAARAWARLTERIDQTGPSCPRFRDIRYEDLLMDPVGVTTDLLGWVGLPVDADVMAALEARAAERVSRYNTAGEVGAGKWTGLSRADVRTIYRHAGDRLVAMGYLSARELAEARSRPAFRLGAVRDRLRSAARRRTGRLARH
jgi:hypothetical protein